MGVYERALMMAPVGYVQDIDLGWADDGRYAGEPEEWGEEARVERVRRVRSMRR